MKIVHVITSLNDGGAEGVLFRLCTTDTVHRHLVISLSIEGKYGPLLRAKGISVIALGMKPNRLPLLALIRLVYLFLKHKPDLVQTWMPHADLLGGIAGRLAGVKSVVWGVRHTSLDQRFSKKTTIWIVSLLAKLSWWLPSRIAVCSKQAINAHEALGYDRTKMRYIPNGYDSGDFSAKTKEADNLRAEWGVEPITALIGTVGRYDPQKDHSNLLQALQLLQARKIDMRCVLVGMNLNAENRELLSQINALNLANTVMLLGMRKDIPVVMSALDLHILPSAYGEAFPNVVAEAMACETPCVVTDVGDAAYIVGDTGWVVPPNDAEALASAIEKALKERHKGQWPQLCLSARQRIQQHFDIQKMISAYHELWHETL